MSENEKKNKYFREYMQDHYDADVKSFRYYKSKYKLTDEYLRKRFGSTKLPIVCREATAVLKAEYQEEKHHAIRLKRFEGDEMKINNEIERHIDRLKLLELQEYRIRNLSDLHSPTTASRTKYPKIFSDCYWGNFRIDLDDEDSYRVEIENRNDFVETYNISAYVLNNKQTQRVRKEVRGRESSLSPDINLDHFECYKNRSGDFVLMASPYGECEGKNDDLYEKYGWIKYKPCYSIRCGATTYIKVLRKIPKVSKVE